jgi:hypothetical protein
MKLLPNEEKFDIWMGSSQAMARKKTWEFVVMIPKKLYGFYLITLKAMDLP